MKVKAAVVILIISFLGWFCYRFFNRPNINKTTAMPMALDWNELEEVPKEAIKDPQSLKTESVESERKERVHESMTPSEEEKFEAYDQMEALWLSKVKLIIDEKHYPQYLSLREQNEKEKLEAYNQYHDYLRSKHGDQFSYKITEDQSDSEKKINERYLKQLLKLIGEQKFSQYLRARDEVNEIYRRKNKLFIQVEF